MFFFENFSASSRREQARIHRWIDKNQKRITQDFWKSDMIRTKRFQQSLTSKFTIAKQSRANCFPAHCNLYMRKKKEEELQPRGIKEDSERERREVL